jgi:hypothetical protein
MPKRRLAALLVFSLCAACSGSASKPPAGPGGEGGGDETGGAGGTGAMAGSGGIGGTGGGKGGTGGDPTGGSGGTGGSAGGTGGVTPDAGLQPDSSVMADVGTATTEHFSFFLTSLVAMRRLAKSEKGFGGDLRYGQPDGLSGADKICTEIAESSMPGAGAKGWRAFLSVTKGPDGNPVHAIDRIGEGPWYDRKGRVLAMTKAALLNARPMGADPVIINDLPNELGVPNHRPDPAAPAVDNHHFLTGSNPMGHLYGPTSTCNDWTALTGAGRPRIGFSWPESGRVNWISGQDEGGCGAGVNTVQTGGSDPGNPIVGSGGGYGGIYCFALKP